MHLCRLRYFTVYHIRLLLDITNRQSEMSKIHFAYYNLSAIPDIHTKNTSTRAYNGATVDDDGKIENKLASERTGQSK